MKRPLNQEISKELTERFGEATTIALHKTVADVLDGSEMRSAMTPEKWIEIKESCEALLEKTNQDLFSSCWAGYHGLKEPLKRFLRTMTAACNNLPPPKRGNKPDPTREALALNIGRCLAAAGTDLRNYDGGDFVFAVNRIFKALGYPIAVDSTRRYVARAIAHLQSMEAFMKQVPKVQQERYKSIQARLPKNGRRRAG